MEDCWLYIFTFLDYTQLFNVSRVSKTFQYIFGTWMPDSGYKWDNRPQFEILGEKYKNNDPSSEEEIWIPIKPN